MMAFQSRHHAQFQARMWREYATSHREWAETIGGYSRRYCLAKARNAVDWLHNNPKGRTGYHD